MRIVAISDTHEQHDQLNIPDGDVLIHSGDFTYTGKVEAVVSFNAWLGRLPHKYKIIIAGNHDKLFERNPTLAESLITNAVYLKDSSVDIEGLSFYGSPWTPSFGHGWAFNANRGEHIQLYWDKIPEKTDVLITHGPPYGLLDEVPHYNGVENVGCEKLMEEIIYRVKPKIHIFGHIHEGYGQIELYSVKFVNASTCTGSYMPTNKPIVIDL
jgi:Icc-related predicted phosphoesterase